MSFLLATNKRREQDTTAQHTHARQEIETPSHLPDRIEKLQESAAKLRTFNDASAEEMARMGQVLERSARVCVQMRRDLEDIFKRLRNVQRVLQQHYPQYMDVAMKAVEENARAKGRSLDEDDEDGDKQGQAAATATP